MINNIEIIEKKYKCIKIVMEYLVYKCHLPVYGIDEKYYYFADTRVLRECLAKMPFYLKIANKLG